MRSLWALVFVISSSACSESRKDCAQSNDCIAAFGFGSTCLPDGYCEAPQVPSRCSRSVPEELISSTSAADYKIIGGLFDRATATQRAREHAMRLAIEEINAAGAFGMQKFGAVTCTIERNSEFDALSRTEAAVAMANYLQSTGVVAAVGPSASADVSAVLESTTGRMVIVSPSATAAGLGSLDGPSHSDDSPGWFWRMTPSDTQAAIAIATDMTKPGVGRMAAVARLAIVTSTDAYGSSLSSAVRSKLTIPVEVFEFSSVAQLGERVAQAAASAADEVMFVSSQISEIVAFLNAAASLPEYANKTIFLTDTAPNADVLAANSLRFSKVRGSRPLPLDKNRDLVFASFVAGYSARFAEDPTTFSFVAQTYDATWLLALSLAQQRSSVVVSRDISRGLRRMSNGLRFETRGSNWRPATEALQAGQGIDIAGASGQLNFDSDSQELSGPVQIWGIDTAAGIPHIVERDQWMP
jgi:branched-chain amino acid transport system substrate-binding protein